MTDSISIVTLGLFWQYCLPCIFIQIAASVLEVVKQEYGDFIVSQDALRFIKVELLNELFTPCN